MRSIFTFTIVVLILTACSQTPTSATLTPLPSTTPTHISTVTPTFSPTFTSTPQAVELTAASTPIPPEVSSAPPAEGWNTVIADGLTTYPEGIAWVDVGGAQHLKFDQGDVTTDEQKIKEIEGICSFYPECILSNGESFRMDGRFTGEMEIVTHPNGEKELLTSIESLNNLQGGTLQRFRVRFLLPDRDEANKYYLKNLGLRSSETEFNLPIILRVFRAGNQFKNSFTMSPGDETLKSLSWQKYGYRMGEEYLKQVQAWFASGLDPEKNMDLIKY